MESWIHSLDIPFADELCMILRLVFAALLGGGMGLERTRKMRAAGLRTYILVSVGAAMTMITGWYIARATGYSDPARIAAQVVSGIGIIGAGTIMMTGYHRVRGLTTAAGLWATGCMGIAIGSGLYLGGLAMFVIMMVSILGGEKLQETFLNNSNRLRLYVLFEDAGYLQTFLVFLREQGITVSDFEQLNAIGACLGTSFVLKFEDRHKHQQVLQMISDSPGVAFVEEI